MSDEHINRLRLEELKSKFIEVYRSNIKREGAEKLLAWLLSSESDFFTAPASAKYHCCHEGGLAEHSLNVYTALKSYLRRPDLPFTKPVDETVAVAALLHDLCKVNVYKVYFRNVKDEVTGKWEKVPGYKFEDGVPYGHGEKSVYMMSGFMKPTREEAMAIRWHMGFSELGKDREVSSAFAKYPLAVALYCADMEASFMMETSFNP